tara:strand:+ start:617 stop:1186 length:570 start_codon:yes stop_codon:yes gene_type:complete
MASYLNLFIRGLKRRYLLEYLVKLPKDKIDVIVCSPGGCGNVTINNHLEKFCISNNYLKSNLIHNSALMHIPKPLKSMLKNKIKIMLIKRDFEEIYESHKKRKFLRNSLVWYGDLFSFYRFKNEVYLKKKFFNYLTIYYKNWESYPNELKLEINYKDLWSSADKIAKFINIKSPEFKKTFPAFKRYEYK